MTINAQELVKALNEYGVLIQNEKYSNTLRLVYNARVKTILGEEVIVLETFRK